MKKILGVLFILIMGVMIYAYNNIGLEIADHWKKESIPFITKDSGVSTELSDSGHIQLVLLNGYRDSFFILIEGSTHNSEIINMTDYGWKFPYSEKFMIDLTVNIISIMNDMLEYGAKNISRDVWLDNKFVTIKSDVGSSALYFEVY
jgi:hypothetical protein